MSDREQAIRDRAHQLWEREGRPHGREHDHWQQAENELADDGDLAQLADGGDASPVPAEDISAINAAETQATAATPAKPRASKARSTKTTIGSK